jgi:hypothetical protein
MYESLGETSKNESLADDNTTLMEFTENNLRNLRSVLENFGRISGLKCNYDKTVVMPIGTVSDDLFPLHGFCLSNRVKLLGLDITNNLADLPSNFANFECKIRKTILFWERFNLTLPGRIAVVKTLLIPQLNYLGCFLTPDDDELQVFQDLFDKFALKGQIISKDRRYLSPEQGGAGLFKLSEFLIAQKCSWVKRAFTNQNDNWRLTLLSAAPDGNLLNLRACDIPPCKSIVLHEIAWAFEYFSGCYSLLDNNYRKNCIFQNIAVCRSGTDNRLLDIDFFGKKFYNENISKIRSLTFDDCFYDGKFRSLPAFKDIGLDLPVSLWMRLQTALTYSKKINRYDSENVSEGKNISAFMNMIKRGSKKFRIIIDNSRYLGDCQNKLCIVNTFAKITNTTSPTSLCLKNILSAWNKSYLENHFRDFLYKFRQNTLRTKDRLAHLIDTDVNCFFCKCFSNPSLHKESFAHLFRLCPFTSNLLLQFLRINRIVIPSDNTVFEETYWYGTINHATCKPTLLLFDCFRYCVWNFKNMKKIPTVANLNYTIEGILGSIFARRPNILREFTNTPHLNFFAQNLRAAG